MNTQDFLAGMMLGAGIMYLMDPDRGRRRRALLRDQAVHGGHMLQDSAEATARDLGNRARGAMAEAAGRVNEGEVDDPVLQQRVRSEIGRAVTNSRAIDVIAENGRVTLRGPVLASEVEELVETTRSVRGVKHVDNLLTVHQSAEDLPSLQGTQGSGASS